MKLVFSLLLASSLSILAQTNPPVPVNTQRTTGTPPASSAVTTNVAAGTITNLTGLLGLGDTATQLANDALSAFVDAQPYLSNSIVQVDTAVLYNKSAGYGAFAGFEIPTSQQTAIGFGGAYIGKTFYDATLNLKLGTTVQVPLFGSCYSYVASGPDYNFSKHSIGAYNFAGIFKKWDVYHNAKGNGFYLSIGPTVGNISTLQGVTYGGTMSLTYHW
jgi:hypothetical protein